MTTTYLRKQSASSLVVVISILATLMVVAAVAAEYTYTVQRHVQRSNTLQNAVAVGDSCIELLFANWRAICSQSTNVRTGPSSSAFAVPSQISLPTASQLNLPSVTNFAKTDTAANWYASDHDDYASDYTISNYKVVAVDSEWNALTSASSTPRPFIGQVAGAITSATYTTPLVYNYIASADVTLPALGPTGKVVAKVRRVFQKQQIAPWNFAIFYVDPLEIHPGPAFTVTGWVHTNSDLYTGHSSLTFADKVTYGSDWFINFMPGDNTHPETPASPNYPSNLPPARDQALQPFGLDSFALFNTTDANPNNDSYHELIQPPVAGYTDPLLGERYWDQADVVIQVDGNNPNNPPIIGKPNVDGTITALPGPSPTARDTALYNMFNTTGAITQNQSITDTRESGSTVKLVDLDVNKIQNNPPSGLLPTFKANDVAYANNVPPYFNGIVYIYDKSATTHSLNADGTVNQNPTNPTRRGVRLKNGSKISGFNADGSIAGLTVVSANPVYIQGDYNTGGSPPSNNSPSDPTTPQVTGYNNKLNPSGPGIRAPCSVLADAVTILSNGFANGNSVSNTTVNTAIVAGIVPSAPVGGDGHYSGGAENFPRFLEDWSVDGGKAFTYYGSMVELYKSQQAIANWSCCMPIYSPPVRQWYFDSNFKTHPPPGSLMIYSYIKGKWSVQ